MTSTLSLLPQSPESIMVDNKTKKLVLNLKLTLLDQLEHALVDFFIKKAFYKFDAHVGDTCCQIRACQLLYIFDAIDKRCFSHEYVNERLSEISALKIRIKYTINALDGHLIIKRYLKAEEKSYLKPTLVEFLTVNECLIPLSKEELFLTYCYILSKFKKFNGIGDICIDYQRLQNSLVLSKALARKLIKSYQVILSELSCDFVKWRLKLLPELDDLDGILEKLECKDDDNRQVLPCFHMSEVLIRDLLHNRKNVLVIIERRYSIHFVDNICMAFEPDEEKKSFKYSGDLTKVREQFLNIPCLLVYGIVAYHAEFDIESPEAYIERFNNLGVEEVLLANMAVHPQYSGAKLAPYKNNPYLILSESHCHHLDSTSHIHRFNKRLELANKYGCSKLDTRLFFIRHIFCELPKNQVRYI